jgi:hypothetical protein
MYARVYPALGQWGAYRRQPTHTVQGYPSSTVEGRFAATGDASMIHGQGLVLDDAAEVVYVVQGWIDERATPDESRMLDLKWIRDPPLSDAALARRMGYGSKLPVQMRMRSVYDRLDERLQLAHEDRFHLESARVR